MNNTLGPTDSYILIQHRMLQNLIFPQRTRLLSPGRTGTRTTVWCPSAKLSGETSLQREMIYFPIPVKPQFTWILCPGATARTTWSWPPRADGWSSRRRRSSPRMGGGSPWLSLPTASSRSRRLYSWWLSTHYVSCDHFEVHPRYSA